MFGGLKKKLQAAISKITKKVEPEAEKEKPEIKETPKIEKPEKLALEKREEIREEEAREVLEQEIEEKREELAEMGEKVHEEHITGDGAALREEKESFEEVKAELEVPEIVKAKPEKKLGLFKRIKEKTISESDVADILKELEIALLESDVAVEVAERISADVKANLLGKVVKRGSVAEAVKEALHKALLDVLSQEPINLERLIQEKNESEKEPFLILFVGFNGTGKTTTLAKLANRLKKFKPVLAAGDTFRAASIEQLEVHAKRLDLDVVKHRYGADSAAVIFDAKKHAAAEGSKVVLADTAGRSHANVNLMDELKKVVRVNKPDLKVLVLDSLTGNDIYDQAKLFNDAVGVDAIILTKADVYEKGGAALSAAFTIRKPILFLGVGQEYGDLVPFEPEKIVKSLLG